MNGMSQQKSGPCYSNVSLIKRALYQSKNGRLPYPDIILFMHKNWNNTTQESDIKLVVDLALNAKKSFFLEDENGLWGIKHQEESLLDPVITFAKSVQKPFQLQEVMRKIETSFNKNELQQSFRRDLRFTEVDGTDFWLLSSWELINDLVYAYLQENRINHEVHIGDILSIVKSEFNLNEDTYIFAPEIDSRFNVRRKLIQVDIEEIVDQKDEKVEVPTEVQEEVARLSLNIINWASGQKGEFTINALISEIFKVQPQHPSHNIYFKAVEEFLSGLVSFSNVERGIWIIEHLIPELNIVNQTINRNQPVFNSKPVISNIDLLTKQSEIYRMESTDEIGYKSRESVEKENTYYYHTISYYERVKGYIILPISFNSFLENYKNTKLKIIADGFEYDCWFTYSHHKYYCYGNGIYTFFTDFLIEPGHRIKVELSEKGNIYLNLLGLDQTYSKEQARYLDIGRINNEIDATNKSIFTIMCEILSIYPSGIHWSVLLEKVNEIKNTTRNTIYNLLTNNNCFVSVTEKRGYWRLELSELSNYYVDENGNEIIEELENENKKIEIKKDTRELIGKKDKTVISKVLFYNEDQDDQEFELPPLEDTFNKWAASQENIRYSKAVKNSNSKEELISILTHSYAKLFCNFAKSRKTHSNEFMDLVQEGFFAMLAAVENYNNINSFANYLNIRLMQHLNRYIADSRLLIRIPVHKVEEVIKLEKLVSSTLLLYGRYPDKDELEKNEIKLDTPKYLLQFSQDYVSIEQYWLFLKYGSSMEPYEYERLIKSWDLEDIISSKMYRFCIDKQCDLITEVNALCDIDEQDTELLWNLELNNTIEKNDLKLRVKEMLTVLSKREREVICLRFGIGDNNGRTLEDVGKIIGVTRERIRQIESKALQKLNSYAKKLDLAIFIS
jgi:RNA polymerase sigma factor (sigma-70 family)